METTVQLLDRAKLKLGITSDYKLAKHLGFDDVRINHYRHGRRIMDDATAIQLAELLGDQPAYVVACCHWEREKEVRVKKVWETIGKKVASLAACALLLAGLLQAPKAEANPISHNPDFASSRVCIMLSLLIAAWSKLLGRLKFFPPRSIPVA